MKECLAREFAHRRIVVLLLLAGSGAHPSCTDRKTWSEDVEIDVGSTIVATHEFTRDATISFGHVGQIGDGGNPVSAISSVLEGQPFAWMIKRDERPIVLRLGNGVPWMVTLDRTEANQLGFRFYQFDASGTAIEAAAEVFPKNLAVQNMWLMSRNGFRAGTPVNEFDVVAMLDPASVEFQRSLTAKMWRRIETGVDYSASDTVDSAFLAAYKAQYISPAAGTPSFESMTLPSGDNVPSSQ